MSTKLKIKLLISVFIVVLITITVLPISYAEDRWQLIIDDQYIKYVDTYTMEMKKTSDTESTITVWYKTNKKNPSDEEKGVLLKQRKSFKANIDNTVLQSKSLASYVYRYNELVYSNTEEAPWELVAPDSIEEHIYARTLVIWAQTVTQKGQV